MTESFSKNFIDYEEYPQSADIQNRCVSMIGRLFNAPAAPNHVGAIGTSCVGSSEAIMLAVLAMKKCWKNKRVAKGLPCDKPNIIMSSGECFELGGPSASFGLTSIFGDLTDAQFDSRPGLLGKGSALFRGRGETCILCS